VTRPLKPKHALLRTAVEYIAANNQLMTQRRDQLAAAIWITRWNREASCASACPCTRSCTGCRQLAAARSPRTNHELAVTPALANARGSVTQALTEPRPSGTGFTLPTQNQSQDIAPMNAINADGKQNLHEAQAKRPVVPSRAKYQEYQQVQVRTATAGHFPFQFCFIRVDLRSSAAKMRLRSLPSFPI